MEGDVIVDAGRVRASSRPASTDGKIQGRLKPTGIRPQFVERFETAGIHLPPNIFGSPF